MNLKQRVALVIVAVVIGVSTPIAIARRVNADQYDSRIQALRSQAAQYQAQAQALGAQADTLQRKLDSINNEISQLQTQIDLSQAEHDKLVGQIAETEKQIADNRDALGEVIADLSLEGKISPLEMLASAKNISDYVDKQTYQSAMQDQLKTTIDSIKQLKVKLDTQKKDVEDILAKLGAQKNSLAAAQAEQSRLVAETRGQESAYQALVASSQKQLEDVASQQRAYYASLARTSRGGSGSGVSGSFQYRGLTPSNGAGGCSGGYPYCMAQDTTIDEWNLYNRECVSYVAWALQYKYGKSVSRFHGDGNAMDWPSSAPQWSAAYRVSDPQPGDAVILPASGGFAPIGHAMIVDSIGGDGWIHVSQYNFYGTGQYSEMDIRNSGVIFLRFRG